MAKILAFSKIFKTSKEQTSSYKYLHFLNSLSKDKLRDILLFSEGDHFNDYIPSLSGKKVLYFNDQNHKFIFKKLLAREPQYLINYVYGGKPVQMQTLGYSTLVGDLQNLPFKNLFFDCIICPFALEGDKFDAKILNAMSALLKNGGRIILSLRHPQLEHILYNQNPSVTGSPENMVSKYFNLLRENHLFTEDIKEGVVNLPLKPFFTREGEYDHYHEYKNTPISLFFRAVKYVRN